MKDKLGKELKVGDEVVYIAGNDTFNILKYSIVSDAHPHYVRVRTQGGEGPLKKLTYPARIAKVS